MCGNSIINIVKQISFIIRINSNIAFLIYNIFRDNKGAYKVSFCNIKYKSAGLNKYIKMESGVPDLCDFEWTL